MARKKFHKTSYEYKRILEILDAYWLEEPDEEFVKVTMEFKHHSGMEQEKCILWRNPKYKKMFIRKEEEIK